MEISALPFVLSRVQRQLQKGRDILQDFLPSPCNIHKSQVLTSLLNLIKALNFVVVIPDFIFFPNIITHSFCSYKCLSADNLRSDLDWTDSRRGCTCVNREV